MGKLITTILSLLIFPILGQDLERVVTTYPKSKAVKELYFVLKSNKKIKHGDYILFFKGEISIKELRNKKIEEYILGVKERGRFSNNVKNGQWTYFMEPSSNRKLEEGNYSNGKKSGIWETHIENGKVVKYFNHDNGTELQTIVKPIWKYPSKAMKNQIEGIVKVQVMYDSCSATNYRILIDIGYGCGNSVIEALKEKQFLEKKYSVKSTKCDIKEETIEVQFKLD